MSLSAVCAHDARHSSLIQWSPNFARCAGGTASRKSVRVRDGAGRATSAFAAKGITVLPSTKSACEITSEKAEPLFAQGTIDLPNHPVLLDENPRNLERKTRAERGTSFPTLVGGHDDHAVAVCMAAFEARRAERKSRIVIPNAIIAQAPAGRIPNFENHGRRNIEFA